MFSMFRKMICLVSFVLVLGLAGDVQAAKVTWTDTTGDHNWFTPTNWDSGTVPTSSDSVEINVSPGATIANEGAVGLSLYLGAGGGTGGLTVNGGTFTTTGQVTVSIGTINMISGTITGAQVLRVGRWGTATLNMTGGTIIATGELIIGVKPASIGHVNLDGGTISASGITMREEAGSVGTMNITTGTLILDGNDLSTVRGFIDNGWITGYDGNGMLLLDYDVTNEGKTTLTATHLLKPNPVDESTVSPGEVELSWTLPDPCVPGQPVLVDVYFTDDLELLQQFTDPAAIQVVSKQNVTSCVVQTQIKTQYYWAVDTYVGDPNDPVFGPIFRFYTDNFPPEVDAGADVVTWLEDGVSTGNLDATVIDNEDCSVQWTVVSEPNDPNSPDAMITDPTAEDVVITLSALGQYILQIEAFDGEYTGSDTVTINVYNDSCEAAQSLPDYVPLVGDINGDCRVDIDDLLLLLENWLQDSSLTERWFKLN